MVSNPNYKFNFINTGNFIDEAIQTGKNDKYQFSEQELRLLFFNELQSPIRSTSVTNRPGEWSQNGAVYKINCNGFRGNDFLEKASMVIAGCSHTYGIGMHENLTWAHLLAEKMGIDYVNLGYPGASINLIIKNIFAYIRKFGKPDIIVCNFPNMERIEVPINRDILVTETISKSFNNKSEHPYLGEFYLDMDYPDENNRPIFSKKPHMVKDVIPMDLPYWMSIQAINMLEFYCEEAGIKLLWSMWDFMTYRSVEKMSKLDSSYFKYKVDIKMDHWLNGGQEPDAYHKNPIQKDDKCFFDQKCEEVVECHQELKDQYPKVFHIGTDLNHWGSHRHAHIADIFYNHIKENHDYFGY